jgi:uncharacterized protein (DUF1697 family)
LATRVAFLRAVNMVTRRVPNARLVELCAGLGYRDPWTYISSGNVVFDTSGRREGIEAAIERAVEAAVGFEATTFVRSAAELRRLRDHRPFDLRPADTYFVTFLKSRLSPAATRRLEALSNDFDTVVVDASGRDVHWLMHGRSVATTLPKKAWDDVVGEYRSTSRNTTALHKLIDKLDQPR